MIATACDNMLLEQDGTISIIRVIDRISVELKANIKTEKEGISSEIQNFEIAIPINAVVCLKSGDFRGEGELTLKAHLPDGTRKDFPDKWNLLMEGDEKGINVHLKFGLSSKHVGLTWIEVYWNSEVLTKFPVRLVREQDSGISNAPNQ